MNPEEQENKTTSAPQEQQASEAKAQKKQRKSKAIQAIPAPITFQPIGQIESCFSEKNGCPRQPLLVTHSRARLRLSASLFLSPNATVEGLEGFSHVWLIFVFHHNDDLGNTEAKEQAQQQASNEMDSESSASTTTSATTSSGATATEKRPLFDKAKVRAPRLDGKSIGVFACRSPYRPNPIGLTVAKLERIEQKKRGEIVIHLSGVDLVDSTPILDIKPYIPNYDSLPGASVGQWFSQMSIEQFSIKTIKWRPEALETLKTFVSRGVLKFYDDLEGIVSVIEQVISLDPRSKGRRSKGRSHLLGVWVDNVNVIVKFVYAPPAEVQPEEEKQEPEGTKSKKKAKQPKAKKQEQTLLYTEIVEVEDWSNGKPSEEELKRKGDLDNMKYCTE